jgi:uncharacterized DUF497 family protein
MDALKFQWDDTKAAENLIKHGISFEEAETVFYDPFAIEFYDDENSELEDRFLLLGISSNLNLLMICHCFRESDSIIRIISARKATKNEAKYYTGEKP